MHRIARLLAHTCAGTPAPDAPGSIDAVASAFSHLDADPLCNRDGPLCGIVVLDLSQMVSGPMATMLLGDQGAEVWKVESPSGAAERGGGASRITSPLSSVVNRNKRCICLDLKDKRATAVLHRMVKRAHVVVHNFRPGAAERLGISYGVVRSLRPDAVYCHITGFGASGPYSGKRVYDPIIQGASGLMSIQADEHDRPRQLRLIVPDKVTAITAAQAITAALLKRERTGRGSLVEVSMLDSVVQMAWPEGFAKETFRDGRPGSGSGSESESGSGQGQRQGVGHGQGRRGQGQGEEQGQRRYEYSRDMVYRCRDGYITVGAIQDKEWIALCAALGKPEWITDPRFATRTARGTNRVVRYNLTEQALSGMTVVEALGRFGDAVPAGVIHHPRGKVLEDPQLRHNQTLFTSTNPRAPFPLLQARPAAQFSESAGAGGGSGVGGYVSCGGGGGGDGGDGGDDGGGEGGNWLRYHAHVLGEDSWDIMMEVGVPEEEARQLLEDKVVVIRKAGAFDNERARNAPREVSSG
jgi:crotonobetainyl-CoA:carnitine CoA-transferase CaiB-like acyl-CoA transferase